jgi:16S rRNA (guanine527-N7)-methyltransferase
VNYPPGEFEEALCLTLDPWSVSITSEQLSLLRQHFESVVLVNQSMNLTRITDPVDAAVKHYADSLAMLAWERDRGMGESSVAAADAAAGVHVLDVGTGAGYPAVPLAVMRPTWRLVALDGTRKKADFVARFAGEAKLENLQSLHAHSDHWESRQVFDRVTTRAVASLGPVMRTCRRRVRRSGRIVAYKTLRLTDEEMDGAKQAADELNLVMEEPFQYELRCRGEVLERALYTVRIA